jgi:hypothetical protein
MSNKEEQDKCKIKTPITNIEEVNDTRIPIETHKEQFYSNKRRMTTRRRLLSTSTVLLVTASLLGVISTVSAKEKNFLSASKIGSTLRKNGVKKNNSKRKLKRTKKCKLPSPSFHHRDYVSRNCGSDVFR